MTRRPGVSISQALASATETRSLELGRGALDKTPDLFVKFFADRPALVVADPNTFAAAGRKVLDDLRTANARTSEGLYAEHKFVELLEQALNRQPAAVPVAVGSGTISDLTKLAAHRTRRRYFTVATAASMDGYTAFGASITFNGSKQTFACPAPLAVVADLNVIGSAPAELNAAGYADLLAKTCGGADWLLADALGIEPLHAQAWNIVQSGLHEALADPAGVRSGDMEALHRLTQGLMLAGFAMQAASSSRPASGAEHQFSHLWDMQHHRHLGSAPSHGFKVAIGTLASTALYEYLLDQPLESLDVQRCCADWAELSVLDRLSGSLGSADLVAVARQETRAKALDCAALEAQLERLRQVWPDLRPRLRQQLLPLHDLKQRLQAAGAPSAPEEIGIDRQRLRRSFWQAWCIRRRFTVLDLAVRTGLLEPALDQIVNRL